MSEAIVITKQNDAPTAAQNIVLSDGKAVSLDTLAYALRRELQFLRSTEIAVAANDWVRIAEVSYSFAGILAVSFRYHTTPPASAVIAIGGYHSNPNTLLANLLTPGASFSAARFVAETTKAYLEVKMTKSSNRIDVSASALLNITLIPASVSTAADADVVKTIDFNLSVSGGVICGISNSYVLESEIGQKGVPHERDNDLESAFLGLLFGRPLADSNGQSGQRIESTALCCAENSIPYYKWADNHRLQRGDRIGNISSGRPEHSVKRPPGNEFCMRNAGGVHSLHHRVISASNGNPRRNGYALSVSGHLERLEGSTVGVKYGKEVVAA